MFANDANAPLPAVFYDGSHIFQIQHLSGFG